MVRMKVDAEEGGSGDDTASASQLVERYSYENAKRCSGKRKGCKEEFV